MRIGLFGGSFDPVHSAHLALARTALSTLGLNQVQLIPAGQPWQRAPLGATPAQRLAMLNLALGNTPGLVINSIEIERNGPTYTIETLEAMPTGPEYFWILGADQLVNFCTWHRWQDVVNRVTLVVAQRPGSDPNPPADLAKWLSENGKQLVHLTFDPMDISANGIRQRIARGQSTSGLITAPVANYIMIHGLYKQQKI